MYLPKMRKIIDVKIYIDTNENLRRHWKIIRDVKERGHEKEKIIKQIEKRLADAQKYIYPQMQFSDLIINYYPLIDIEPGVNNNINLGLKLTLDTNVHIEAIFDYLNIEGSWDYNIDLNTQYIDLIGEPKANYNIIARSLVENIDELLDESFVWLNGYSGFIQLVVLLIISEKMKGN